MGGIEKNVINKMENGWIKLHRRLLDNPMIQKPKYLALWIVLLLKANHQDKKFMWNGNIILIKEGQMVTGRKELSKETNIPESTIEDILGFLERQHQITQVKNTQYRVITIVNWVKHQSKKEKPDNVPTTFRQRSDTNKNDNNVKNTNIATKVALDVFNFKDYLKGMEDNKGRHINVIGHYFEQKGLTFDSKEEVGSAIKRHLRAAMEVAKFTDAKIVKATDQAKKETDKWTVETILKVLTR